MFFFLSSSSTTSSHHIRNEDDSIARKKKRKKDSSGRSYHYRTGTDMDTDIETSLAKSDPTFAAELLLNVYPTPHNP